MMIPASAQAITGRGRSFVLMGVLFYCIMEEGGKRYSRMVKSFRFQVSGNLPLPMDYYSFLNKYYQLPTKRGLLTGLLQESAEPFLMWIGTTSIKSLPTENCPLPSATPSREVPSHVRTFCRCAALRFRKNDRRCL
jgi:hypothetical protein